MNKKVQLYLIVIESNKLIAYINTIYTPFPNTILPDIDKYILTTNNHFDFTKNFVCIILSNPIHSN